jgi:hypothetical protein
MTFARRRRPISQLARVLLGAACACACLAAAIPGRAQAEACAGVGSAACP